jgi:D-serine deaminase-like pyridoxal phosphate-dependent protein
MSASTGAASIARVAGLPGLQFRGLLSHAGHAYGAGSEAEIEAIAATEAHILTSLADSVRALGVPVEEISVGSTPSARFSVHQSGITEIRPGNYIYFDRTQVGLGAAEWEDCALTVLARVVSAPAAGRIILDSGSKTLTNDQARGFGATPGHGIVLDAIDSTRPDESLIIERLSEEHANVRATGPTTLRPGDLVRVIPNHSCVVSNLVDQCWVVDGQNVVDRLDVAARGRIA